MARIPNIVRRAVQRVLGSAANAPGGQIITYNPRLDQRSGELTKGLTYAKLRSYLRAVEDGDLATTLQLFEDIEARDLHLQAVANTRRIALTGLEWEVSSSADTQDDAVDKTLADEAAAFIRETFDELDAFPELLEHLAGAIGPNIAVAELVWEGSSLVAAEGVPPGRLILKLQEDDQVRVITEDEPTGMQLPANKFIVHIPNNRAGFPFRCTVSQAAAWIHLIKAFALQDWATFTELFGMPVRWGTYRGQASADEKTTALNMLRNMGSAGYGLFSEAIELKYIESTGRGSHPYKELIDWCERKQSIGFLGQNLTTDTSGGTGTFAAASVQDQVRQDLLEDDVQREARTIRRQLIAPLCAIRFPGFKVPLPSFSRKARELVDRKAEGEVIRIASQDLGMRVSSDWAYERLGIPKPQAEDEIIERIETNPFAEESATF